MSAFGPFQTLTCNLIFLCERKILDYPFARQQGIYLLLRRWKKSAVFLV
jgi:hypothetical protein